MSCRSIFLKLSFFAILALVVTAPAAARGNTTSGIYPGTIKDVCVGDTIFVGEMGLNLTPLTPYANGVVQELRNYQNNNPSATMLASITVSDSHNFNVGSVKSYGTYFPVVDGQILTAYPIQIQPFIPMYPVNVVITSSRGWVVANGIDSALLTVTVTDGGNNPIAGVNLAMSASAPWGLRDSALTTDGTGKAQTLFLPTTTSGAAIITASASVQGVTTAPVTTTQVQNIDAGTPYFANLVYPSTATVSSQTTITVQVTDRYGNPVTGGGTLTNVSFLTTTSGAGVFLDGMGNRLKAIPVPLNATGYAAVTFLVGTQPGDNYVSIIPPAPISSSLIDIVGIGDSIPFSITQTVSPAGNPPFIFADGKTSATIEYGLFDQWGNPAADQAIQIVTSAGENQIFTTNQEGSATILYGPKISAGFYSITATAAMNSSVSISQTLQFGSMDPTDMLLTASPQTMASLDVNPSMMASVIAKVIDGEGNPVSGQNVTFTIQSSSNGTYVQTQPPAIGSIGNTDPISVITDENGQAVLDYYPGAFPTPGSAYYSETAQGTTTVSASWAGPNGIVNRSIDLTYENYPFVSVYTDVNPKTVQTGGLVDVSVLLKGDGWALQPKPIDVVLCIDRSGSMLFNSSVVNGVLFQESMNDRIMDAMNAADTFVAQTGNNDRVGVISFGAPSNGIALLFNTSYNPGDPLNLLYLPTGTNTAKRPIVDKNAWRAGPDYTCTVGQPCSDSLNRNNLTDKRAYV